MKNEVTDDRLIKIYESIPGFKIHTLTFKLALQYTCSPRVIALDLKSIP